ncbi:hypothetical protein SPZE110945_12190 [Sphingomonas zeae]
MTDQAAVQLRGPMYDEIMLASSEGDDRWEQDHAALEAAWREAGTCPVPIARFSTASDVIGHFYFASGPAAAAAFYLTKRAFDALSVWLQGRAGRKVHVRLADGTELSAATPGELAEVADVVERLRPSPPPVASSDAPIADPVGTER